MSNWLRSALCGASMLALGACASDKFVGRPNLQVAQPGQGDLPLPDAGDIAAGTAYRIGPLDKINITVYGVDELSKVVQVDGNGIGSLPLVGTFDALGQTPAQLATLIEQRLRGRYVRNPNVSVTIDTINQQITVDGQVVHPGNYAVSGRMTLIRAIASASGVTEYANTNYVVVFRQSGGKQYAGLYDLRAIRQGIYPDPAVYPNDVVVVGESGGRRIFQFAIQGGGLLIAPLIAILN